MYDVLYSYMNNNYYKLSSPFYIIAPSITNVALNRSSNTPLNVGSNTDVFFTCTVQVTCIGTCSAMLSVTWFNSGTQISTGASHKVSGTGSFSSTFSLTGHGVVSVSHAGCYTCGAQLGTGPRRNSNTVNLNVQRK